MAIATQMRARSIGGQRATLHLTNQPHDTSVQRTGRAGYVEPPPNKRYTDGALVAGRYGVLNSRSGNVWRFIESLDDDDAPLTVQEGRREGLGRADAFGPGAD